MRAGNYRTRFFLISAVLMGTLIAGGCSSGGGSTTPTSSGVSYSKDVQPIFNNYCVVCHQIQGEAGLALEPNRSYNNLVGVQSTQSSTQLLVKAGAPEESYLLAKLNGTQAQAGGSGVRMPYGAAPLSQAQLNLIRQWITDGASNN